jgi:hypothetical protein
MPNYQSVKQINTISLLPWLNGMDVIGFDAAYYHLEPWSFDFFLRSIVLCQKMLKMKLMFLGTLVMAITFLRLLIFLSMEVDTYRCRRHHL